MSFEAAVHAQAIELGRLSLEMCAEAGSGHPSSAMSISHIVTVLMFHNMRWSPDYPDYPTSDRLVLSEGHAVPAIYAAAAKLGVMVGVDPDNRERLSVESLMSLRQGDSILDGHPNPQVGFPFFDAATGSLGQGLSVAAGLGESARLDGFDKRIFCIIGDGEAREGQVSEALDYVIDRNLNNVLAIFNCNGYGQADRVSEQQSPDRMSAKLEAYGFDVRVIDGHDPAQITQAFDAFSDISGDENARPMAIVAKTVKGWGAPSIQGGGWHGKPPTGDGLRKALEELDDRRVELTSSLVSTDAFTIQMPMDAPAREMGVGEIPSLSALMRELDMESLLATGRLSTRKAYGLALRALGAVSDRVVVLDADVSNSTFAEMFAKEADLQNRFFECKIGEQNMMSMGVGFSAAQRIPFCSTFAKFVTRAYDQIEMALYSGANLKIIGSHAGISLAADGPSQMSLPDISWFRSLSLVKDHRGNPGIYILQPADAFAAYALTQVMAEYEGMVYMRTLRPETEFLYTEHQLFNLGAFEVLNEGRDIVLCAAGFLVHEANKAVDRLDEMGISATLIDLYSLPFDKDKLLDIVGANGGYVISIEDNFGGGIGSAIADALVESGDGFTLEQMFVKRIPKSARTPEEIVKMCGLSADDIVAKVAAMLQIA